MKLANRKFIKISVFKDNGLIATELSLGVSGNPGYIITMKLANRKFIKISVFKDNGLIATELSLGVSGNPGYQGGPKFPEKRTLLCFPRLFSFGGGLLHDHARSTIRSLDRGSFSAPRKGPTPGIPTPPGQDKTYPQRPVNPGNVRKDAVAYGSKRGSLPNRSVSARLWALSPLGIRQSPLCGRTIKRRMPYRA